jgi:phosphoribosyl-ATP pyrophosphohydrolase/phosphoribosyl-AMP cyclohydrolase
MSQEMRLDANGLVPAVVQDDDTGQVLMLAYVSEGSLRRTLEGGNVWFYSRSRDELWQKGETSGNYLRVRSVWADCDGDALLIKASPTGPACHTGETSCFFTPIQEPPATVPAEGGVGILDELFAVIKDRQAAADPAESYTAKLLASGVGRVAQKVVEEAGESAIAAAQGQTEALPGEVADLLYHTLVLLAATGVPPEDVWAELRKRRR